MQSVTVMAAEVSLTTVRKAGRATACVCQVSKRTGRPELGSNIVYHDGTSNGLASGILLHAGFKGTKGCYCDVDQQVTYFLPSIVYSAHKRYANVWHRKEGGKY